MADTCIVCLGDLNGGGSDLPTDDAPPISNGSLEVVQENGSSKRKAEHDQQSCNGEEELIAHLLPCGHNLHDECLKPWVERANSCPICRASFNEVELSATVGGPVVSRYAVQDKQQVADIDPSLIVEDDLFDISIDPCMVCEEYGDESQLLLCDGCDASCHVFCAGLDEVPAGAWFCYSCQQDTRASTTASRAPTTARQRRSGRQGRGRARSSEWEQIWQAILLQTGLDLDFPTNDDDYEAAIQRNLAQRREFNEWQRRFQVAARQGAASRFRDTAAVLLNERPEPESHDEIRAWNAFDKARTIDEDPSAGNRRKRKSATASPAEPSEPEPERRLKRPRTRRAQDPVEAPTETTAESSTTGRVANTRGTAQASSTGRPDGSSVPTFLQSLLKEVEAQPVSPAPGSHRHDDHVGASHERTLSPRLSSPEASPPVSNLPTPRALTPPPYPAVRPSSPPPLSSSISPINYPRAVDFSPYSPADEDKAERARSRQRKRVMQSPDTSPPRSSDASPTRTTMSYSTKSEIQMMVKAALKPLYQKQEVSKDEYTDINRDVSRLLYDKVGDAGGLADQHTRERWQRVASAEVESAVKALRAARVVPTGASWCG